MSVQLIESAEDIRHLSQTLIGQTRLAIDLEAAGFHRYSDKVCLLQITFADQTFLIDTLSVDSSEELRPIFQDPNTLLILHGGAFDLRLLHRDLHIFPVHLFDTQIAASLIGESSLGLAALLNKYLGVELSKKYQRADWAKRPLSKEMLAYAAADTQHLSSLCDLLTERLHGLGRLSWVAEESEALAGLRWKTVPPSDPVLRVKGSKYLSDKETERLRAACQWRESIAKQLDRAHFRVAGDPVLLEIARLQSCGLSSITNIKGMPSKIVTRFGRTLVNDLERIDSLQADQLIGYPSTRVAKRLRLSDTEEKALDKLKLCRNRTADQLGIARGSLMSNALLSQIASSRVGHSNDLLKMHGVRNWHIEVFGDDILKALKTNP
ncbi:uncharacterized protein METZ01_LOCUS224980 [marine metagenome]|uniref:HRDC domain-containing protein n=1 Tax=marine metagenome TaxID=408172 RepID=A0A382GA51_9ZZZZ